MDISSWNTGNVIHCFNTDGNGELSGTTPFVIYEAPAGDILSMYIIHMQKPWWRKFSKNWKDDEKKLRSILHGLPIIKWHERV